MNSFNIFNAGLPQGQKNQEKLLNLTKFEKMLDIFCVKNEFLVFQSLQLVKN